ncbi:MAG: ABC transporter permease [Victivallaceae bacterium]
MRDLLTLWSLELRRGRGMLVITLAVITVVSLICFSGIFSAQVRNATGLIAFFALLFVGCFVSSDVVARDFKDKTINFYLALPIPNWKLYLGKYLASLFVFTVFAALPITLLMDSYNKIINSTKLDFIAGIAAFLLLLHAMTFVWTIMLRGDKVLLFAMILTPLALLLFLPGMIWIYDIGTFNVISRNSLTAGWLVWTLFFLIGGWFLWRIGVVRGRPLLKPGLLFLLALTGASLASWAVFQAIDITGYIVTLRKFEHTPGIEIVRGPLNVPEAIMTFDAKKSGGDALITLDFDKKMTIPAEAYPVYYRKQKELCEAIAEAIRSEAKLDNRTKLVALLRLQEKFPAETIPMRSGYLRRGDHRHSIPMPVELSASPIIANLQAIPPSPELIDFYRALPRYNTQPIRVAAHPDAQRTFVTDGTSYPGKNPNPGRSYDGSLRNFLPGASMHGWNRFAAVFGWVIRHNFAFPPFAGSELQKATATMKVWMAALAAEHELNCAVPPEKIPEHIRNFQLSHPRELTTKRIMRIIATCQSLPYLRLREWQIREGKLPDDPGIVLTPEEKGYLELHYCAGFGSKHQPIDKPKDQKVFLHISFTGLPDRQHLCLELPIEKKRGEASHE